MSYFYQSFKFKAILSLLLTCICAAAGAKAVGRGFQESGIIKTNSATSINGKRLVEDECEVTERNPKIKKASHENQSSNNNNADESMSLVIDPSLNRARRISLAVLPKVILQNEIFSYLTDSDLLRMRLLNRQFCEYASAIRVWQRRTPQINLFQVWSGGPESETFANIVLNRILYGINRELGIKHLSDPFNPETLNRKLKPLDEMSQSYTNLKGIFDCYNCFCGGDYQCFYNRKPVNTFAFRVYGSKSDGSLEEIPKQESRMSIYSKDKSLRFDNLKNRGNAEKSLLQLFLVMAGAPFSKNSPLYVAPSSGQSKSFVEQLGEESDLRKRIFEASSKIRKESSASDYKFLTNLYEELLKMGVYVTTRDYRAAAELYSKLGQYEKAAMHMENVLNCPDATSQDYRAAALLYSKLGQYEKAVMHMEKVLSRPAATTQDYGTIAFFYSKLSQYEKVIENIKKILSHPNATAQDHKNAENLYSIYSKRGSVDI